MDNIAPFLALLVTIAGWIYTAIQQKRIFNMQVKAEKEKELRNDLQEKIKKVEEHLSDYARLNQLYRLRSSFSEHIVEDENGNPILESPQKFKTETKFFFSDERIDEALRQMKGFDIISLTDQTKAKILLDTAEVNDILAELDPSKQINELLLELYSKSIYRYDLIIDNPDSWSMVHTVPRVAILLNGQTETRRELRVKLDEVVKKKLDW